MYRSKLIANLVVLSFVSTSFISQSGFSAPAQSDALRIPGAIRAAIGEFAVSKTPVYLPTWLPQQCKGPLDIGSGPFKDGYELWLGTASCNTTFFTSAGKGSIKKTRRSVKLSNGTTAYVQDLKDFCMDYLKGGYCYRVGLPGYGQKKDLDNLVKIANSMIAISPQVMNSSPKGEERLAGAYKRIVEAQVSEYNRKLAQTYDAAFDSIASGNFVKAETQLNEVLKNWSDCVELPPVQQIHLARSLILKKLQHDDEAERIQKQYAGDSAKLEAQWKEKIVKQSDRSYRSRLYCELADFYIAEGRFSDAHENYKKALAEIVPIFGAQSYDARQIAIKNKRLEKIEAK